MSAQLLPAIAALTFNADRTAEAHLQRQARGRRAGAATDQLLARDIAQSAYEDVLGVRPRPHRKDS